jgi:hypothetical protein
VDGMIARLAFWSNASNTYSLLHQPSALYLQMTAHVSFETSFSSFWRLIDPLYFWHAEEEVL